MKANLLASLFENWPKFDIGEGAFYAVFGFLFVFFGIVLLILIFTGLGKIMSIRNAKTGKKEKKPVVPEKKANESGEAGVTPELLAVLTAAIAAYYEDEDVQCDFVVRRIKKL